MQRFWIQPNIITFVLLGWFLTKCTLTLSEGKQSRVAVLTCFVLVLPFTAYWRNVERVDQSANDHFRQYALAVLDTLPRDSLLFVNYDQQVSLLDYACITTSCADKHNRKHKVDINQIPSGVRRAPQRYHIYQPQHDDLRVVGFKTGSVRRDSLSRDTLH